MDLVEKTKRYVKNELKGYDPGHDWYHIERVWKNARSIAKHEKCNMLIVELGALLHDIADWKFHGKAAGPKKARHWLKKNNVEPAVIEQVAHIVENVSFKGAKVRNGMRSIEGKIVQDADRLDAIGAIGVARAFVYGGYKGHAMYDPTEKITLHRSEKAYEKSTASTIIHFHEKLLLLANRMNTRTGKKLAWQRHKYMKGYVNQFLKEWAGKV